MKFFLFIVIVSMTSFCSCQTTNIYSAQINTVDTLIHAFFENDTTKIGELIGVNPEKIGEDLQHFVNRVNLTSKLVKQNGIPPKSSYEIKAYPKESDDLINIIVPLTNNGINKKIAVRFVKFLPPNRIAFFQVMGLNVVGEKTIAPQ